MIDELLYEEIKDDYALYLCNNMDVFWLQNICKYVAICVLYTFLKLATIFILHYGWQQSHILTPLPALPRSYQGNLIYTAYPYWYWLYTLQS